MITENLSSLNINKLTQEQYERAREEGKLETNAIYLTPDAEDLFKVGEGEDSVVRIVEPNPEKPEAQPTAYGPGSLALMRYAHADGKNAVALGYNCKTAGQYGFSTGHETEAAGIASAAFNFHNIASGVYSFAAGANNVVAGYTDAAFGSGNEIASDVEHSFAAGQGNKIYASEAVALGSTGEISGQRSFTFGELNKVSAYASSAFGSQNEIQSGSYNFVAGYKNMVSDTGTNSILIGSENKVAGGKHNFAAGQNNELQSGSDYSIALGAGNTVSGVASLVIGSGNQSTGSYTVVTGYKNGATGVYSYAGGTDTFAQGAASFAHGAHVKTTASSQAAFGTWNNPNSGENNNNYLFTIGNGTSEQDRRNALSIKADGSGVLAGKLTVGANPTDSMDVATKNYVDNQVYATYYGEIVSETAREVIEEIAELVRNIPSSLHYKPIQLSRSSGFNDPNFGEFGYITICIRALDFNELEVIATAYTNEGIFYAQMEVTPSYYYSSGFKKLLDNSISYAEGAEF